MYYATGKLPPFYHQMTLEELIFGDDDAPGGLINANTTNTRTLERDELSDRFKRRCNVQYMTNLLRRFNESTEYLREVPRKTLYREFRIPKRTGGGLRKIDAPNPELHNSLGILKTIIETQLKPGNTELYHTSAFAYIKGRCTVDAVKRHKESNWFAKYDLSNFFGSTTLDFTVEMLSKIFPFCLIMEDEDGKRELTKALELGFLDGGLPQGTPLSPTLTNIIMIPIDFKLSKALRDFDKQSFVYTRYADDFHISSKYDFKFRDVENLIREILGEFNAPYVLKPEKTHYGSIAGSNWMLGVMLNKDHEITVGYKKKKQLKAMLASYAMDKKNGTQWEKEDIQAMDGCLSYCKMVEGQTISEIVTNISNKFKVNIPEMIRADLYNQ